MYYFLSEIHIPYDIEPTKKLGAVGKALEIQSLDHIVRIREAYYSFADEDLCN